MKLNLLFVSTPVGPLGSGLGGGVELSLKNVAQEMRRRGHQVQVVAPAGSQLLEIPVREIAGNWQTSIQTEGADHAIVMPDNAVLANMWEYVRQVQGDWDLILNFAYDWLPFYLTPSFQRPVAHFITMGALTALMKRTVGEFGRQFPHRLAFYTQTQAETFGLGNAPYCLGSALDLSLYQFCEEPQSHLAWIGRISPEKALEDAVATARAAGITLRIFGKLQDPNYWERIRQDYPDAPVDYRGFFSTSQLQAELGQSQALLMTPRWVEAFGNVVIEALACGVPVIAYRRGGPAEIIRHGETGFLVEPDSVPELLKAINRLDAIDRRACRQQVEAEYSLCALGDRFEAWFWEILKNSR